MPFTAQMTSILLNYRKQKHIFDVTQTLILLGLVSNQMVISWEKRLWNVFLLIPFQVQVMPQQEKPSDKLIFISFLNYGQKALWKKRMVFSVSPPGLCLSFGLHITKALPKFVRTCSNIRCSCSSIFSLKSSMVVEILKISWSATNYYMHSVKMSPELRVK